MIISSEKWETLYIYENILVKTVLKMWHKWKEKNLL